MVSRSRNASDDEKEAAKDDLQKILKLAPGSIVALRVNAPEFQRTRLQIGMDVPDIKGEDIDGIEFKLSDYKGKVVVIDFWGDW